MKKIEEIKKEFENRIPSEAKENTIIRETGKYYKKKRFFLPVTLLTISAITFFILKNFLWKSEGLPVIILLTFIVSIIIASSIPVVHVLLKSDKGKLDELIKEEEFALIEKKIKKRQKEINELKKEKNDLEENIIELETEKKVLESMI